MRKLWFAALFALLLSWSPAASADTGNGKLAIVRAGDIWTVEPDGGGLTNVTNERAGTAAAPLGWSGDGAWLAFDPIAPAPPLFLVRADGSELRSFPDTGRFVCWLGPARLVVLRDFYTPPRITQDLFVVDTARGELRHLTTDGGAKDVNEESCARDGSEAIYVRTDETSHSVAYGIPAAGGEPIALTPPWTGDSSATLAPSGDQIAVIRSGAPSTAFNFSRQVAVLGRDGALEDIAATAPAVTAPLWSADGRRLLYETQQTVQEGPYSEHFEFRVEVAAADGSGDRPLTAFERVEPRPEWSPDGKRIAFLSAPAGSSDLWVANADGTCPARIATDVSAFAWQPRPGASASEQARCADLSIATQYVSGSIGTRDQGGATFRITNIGNELATGIAVVIATSSPAAQIGQLELRGGQCDLAAARCTIPSLPPGATVYVNVGYAWTESPDFSGSIAPTSFGVSASVSAAEQDPDRSNNSATGAADGYQCTNVSASYGDTTLRGTSGRDVLCGLGGRDLLYGLAGADTLVGGRGGDFLDGGRGADLLLGEGGNDKILASDGMPDRVDCGRGHDVAIVDRRDSVQNCESDIHPQIPCEQTGTADVNRMYGTKARDLLCGLGGNDTLYGFGGNDALDGGQGNDNLDGGPGHDALYGGAGLDLISARDGERDRIDCGPGYDTAIVDRLDLVAKNCEHVLRPGR